MRLVSRLAPPAAIATLAAATLAIPAAPAHAEKSCRADAIATASDLMMYSLKYMLAGDVKGFNRDVEAMGWAVTGYTKCNS